MGELQKIPDLIEKTLESHLEIKKIAEKFSQYKDFFFL
jgi:glucosamine 6-phosphate synthetase-like amidotransferase/phosphosugar isomerase protein